MKNIKKYTLSIFALFVSCAFPSCADLQKNISTTLMSQKRNISMIKLFVYPRCPYCIKVINYLKSSNNQDKVQIIDVTQAQNLQELRQLNNNNTQCPFLYDQEKNVKMLESLDIIEYLKKRFEK